MEENIDLYFQVDWNKQKTEEIIEILLKKEFADITDIEVMLDGGFLTINYVGDPEYKGIIRCYVDNLTKKY